MSDTKASTPSIVEHLKQEIANFKQSLEAEKIGTVIEVGDGIVKATGLAEVRASEMVEFDNGIQGVALNLEEGMVGIMVMGDYTGISEGMKVKSLGKILEVPVGEGLIGRVVDALGNPKDGKGPIKASKTYPMERVAPGVITRKSVH